MPAICADLHKKNKLNVSFVASYMFVNIDVFIKYNNVLS